MTNKLYIFAWATWYPLPGEVSSIFVKKHIDLIAGQHNVKLLNIHFNGKGRIRRHSLKSPDLHEVIYEIPGNKLFKALSFALVPLIEAWLYWLNKGRIDIFHLHEAYPTAAFLSPLRLIPMKRWVFTEHWTGFNDYCGQFADIGQGIRNRMMKRLPRFDAGSYVSEGLRDAMMDKGLCPPRNVIVNNVLQSKDNAAGAIAKTEHFSFCTLSFLDDRHKNISGMIRAFADWCNDHPEVKLHIYGSGPDKEELSGLISNLGAGNNVVLEGLVENARVPEVYARHHAFVLFSNYETFSIATAEALLTGLPSIATISGGPEDYLTSDGGILVEVNNTEQLKKAFSQIFEHYHEYDPEKVKATVAHMLDRQKILDQFNTLYLA